MNEPICKVQGNKNGVQEGRKAKEGGEEVGGMWVRREGIKRERGGAREGDSRDSMEEKKEGR